MKAVLVALAMLIVVPTMASAKFCLFGQYPNGQCRPAFHGPHWSRHHPQNKPPPQKPVPVTPH